MGYSGDRTVRKAIRIVLGGLFGFILLIFLIWAGYRAYAVFESRHIARRAAAFLSGGDLRQSALAARRAVQLDPMCVPAMRVLAELGERTSDRSALAWRRQVLSLEPDSLEDRLALINCLLQFKDIATVEKMLGQIDDKGRQTAGFHASTAHLAEAKRNFGEAETEWSEAVKLAPENKTYQLQLGTVLLKSENGQKRQAGMAMLEKMRSDPKQRAAATRALVMDGVTHRLAGTQLIEMARELQSYPESTFKDRLTYLDFLRQVRDPKFTERLTEIEKEASANPTNLAELISWMNANGMSLLAIDFVRTLPGDASSKWPVPLSLAEAYSNVGDWSRLMGYLKNKDWSEFEFLRHAYLSRAYREEGNPGNADREWTAAQKGAGNKIQMLSVLSYTVSGWGWTKESEELLWLLSKHAEMQWEALDMLYRKYAGDGDTPGLYRVLTKLSELAPADPRIQNNLAQLRLLLNADVDRAKKIAEEVYQKQPTNPAYASTWAFALLTEGDSEEALRIMSELNERDLRDPGLATYYGVVLAAAGQKAKAKEYLDLAATGKLLPEEKALIAKAQDSIK